MNVISRLTVEKFNSALGVDVHSGQGTPADTTDQAGADSGTI